MRLNKEIFWDPRKKSLSGYQSVLSAPHATLSMKAAELYPLLYSSLRSTMRLRFWLPIRQTFREKLLKYPLCTGHSKLKKTTIGWAIIELYLCLRAGFPIFPGPGLLLCSDPGNVSLGAALWGRSGDALVWLGRAQVLVELFARGIRLCLESLLAASSVLQIWLKSSAPSTIYRSCSLSEGRASWTISSPSIIKRYLAFPQLFSLDLLFCLLHLWNCYGWTDSGFAASQNWLQRAK